MNENVAFLNIGFPRKLRDRAHAIAKKYRTSTTKLVNEGLTERLKQIEAEERAEEARQREDKLTKKAGTQARSLGRMGDNPLAPAHADLSPSATGEIIEQPVTDRFEPFYTAHAQLIFSALENPREKQLRVAEAVAAVKRHAPLTHPADSEILAALEKRVIDLRAAHLAANPPPPAPTVSLASPPPPAPTRMIDNLVNRVLNIASIKSAGDVESTDADA